jgi:hypothetical protein
VARALAGDPKDSLCKLSLNPSLAEETTSTVLQISAFASLSHQDFFKITL